MTLEQILEIIKLILGPGLSVMTLVGGGLYIRSEKRKKSALADQEENKAKLQKTEDAERVKKMALDLAEEYRRKDGVSTISNETLRADIERIRKMYYKIDGKITRIVQLVKQNVEYRQRLAKQSNCMPGCIGADQDMLNQIEAIMAENGEEEVTTPTQ